MRWWRGKELRRLLTALVMGSLAFTLIVLLAQLSQSFSEFRKAPAQNFQWMAYQLGKEYDRLRIVARDNSDDLEAIDASLRLRFDILMSRFALLDAPAFSAFDQTIELDPIRRDLDALDRFLSQTPLLDRAALDDIDADLSEGRAAIDRLILAVLHHVGELSDRRRAEIEQTIVSSVLVFSLLCIALLVTLLLVSRQRARLQQREADLGETTRTLSDAQRIARLGSVTYDVLLDRLKCSSELSRICDIATDDTLSARSLLRRVHPEDRHIVFELIRSSIRARRTEEPVERDFEVRLKDACGSIRHVRGAIEARFGRFDGQTSLTATLQDVTREVASVRALEAARDEADRANGAKSEFLAMMSHELRTPMNGVLGMLDALKDDHLTKPQERLVTVAHQSAKALLTILNDILDMSKIEAGKLVLEENVFELHSMVGVVGSLYRQEAESKEITLDWHIDNTCPNWLVADGVRLRQVLLNLVSNAVKFTAKGGVHIRVRELTKDESGRSVLRIMVTDSGVGIPDEKRNHVFAPFDQLDRSYTRRFGGTGLGLAISKTLVELMGGTIDFESEVGFGTTFWCDIPFARALAPERLTSFEQSAQPTGLDILVAEDDATNQLVARLVLEALGHRPTIVADGHAAVSFAAKTRYDVILMDISLPGIDGIEATRQIRSGDGLSRETTIFAVSAHTMASDIQNCLEAGMNDFVSKPIDRAKLAGLLGTIPTPDGSVGTEPPSDAPSSAAIVDLERFQRLPILASEIGEEAMTALVAACVADLKKALRKMTDASAGNDPAALRKAAHSVRGIAAMIGEEDLIAEATGVMQAESLAISGSKPLETKISTTLKDLAAITNA
ncbi:ATP-binding protein [Fulvimarina sp. MAC3]|uniref:hybrid sensor histidine kinase/response regulator n=1 Tax=Fulvimarina sp. MAC3 TaxID=3148887 RepID=UPI0031FCB17D